MHVIVHVHVHVMKHAISECRGYHSHSELPHDRPHTDNTNEAEHMKHTDNTPTSPGPLGYWLRVIDRRLHERMREIFEAEGLTRRDWHRLNLIGGGAAPDARIAERLAAHPEKVAPLI